MRLFSRRLQRRTGTYLMGAGTLALALSGCTPSAEMDALEVKTAKEYVGHLCQGDYLAADAMTNRFDQYANPNVSTNFLEELDAAGQATTEIRGEIAAEVAIEILATRPLDGGSSGIEIDLSGTCGGAPFATTLTVAEHEGTATVQGAIPTWETAEFVSFNGRAIPLAPAMIATGVQLGSINGPAIDKWLLPPGPHTVTFAPHFMVQAPAEITLTSAIFSVSTEPAELTPDTSASTEAINTFLEHCGDICAIPNEDIGASWSQHNGAVTPVPLDQIVAADGTFTGSHVLLQTTEPLDEITLELNAWSADGPNSGLAFPTRGYGSMLEIMCPEGESCTFDADAFTNSSMRIGKFFLAEVDGTVEVVLIDPMG